MRTTDDDYMSIALNLAKKGLGSTSPNPMVGSIIVKDNRIIGKGYHKKAGGPHAEINALKEAGPDAIGASMYVNLEPCCHTGRTPPCTESIIKAGVKRVIIGMLDPNPLVCGEGIEKLKSAGIDVKLDVMREEAEYLNRYYAKYVQKKIPYIVMKAAISLDGKIALKNYESRWISNAVSRKKVQYWRNQVDSIMIGYRTFIYDNPHLSNRTPNAKKEPYKIIIVGKNTIKSPKQFNLVKENADRIIIVQNIKAGNDVYSDIVHKVITLKENFTLKDVMKQLGKLEISSVLVEGGGRVFTDLISEKLIDEYIFFIAPLILGNDGISFYQRKSPESIKNAIKLSKIRGNFINGDIYLEMKND